MLLALLVSAAFFDGYDAQVGALLLPQIQESFHVSTATIGIAHVPIALGQFFAFFAVLASDRLGRRPLLLWSVAGYTVCTALTAAASGIWSYAALQFGAQVFLGAEFGVAVAVVMEEFPPERRGRALGALLMAGPVGAIVVGVLLGVGLQRGPLSWRAFYLVGLVPLLVVTVARRRMSETRAFSEERRRATLEGRAKPALLAPWRSPWRGRLVLVGSVSFIFSLYSSAAVTWWAFYAERERGFSTSLVALFLIAAYGIGTFGYLACGRLMERYGRRPVALAYTSASVVAALGVFSVTSRPLGFALLAAAVFFGLGIGPALSAFATELFPTGIRAQASGWVRNWFAVVGQAGGPAIVGILGDRRTGALGSVGGAVEVLVMVALANLWLIARLMPETRGTDLTRLAPAPSGASPRRVRRSFAAALVCVVAVLGLSGAGLEHFGAGADRAGGTAAAWLSDVGAMSAPTGARLAATQAGRLGAPSAEAPLALPAPGSGDAFSKVLVGRARSSGSAAQALFVVWLAHGGTAQEGVVRLVRSGGLWRVEALTGVRRVASSKAVRVTPPGNALGLAWLERLSAGACIAVVVAAAVSLAVRAAGGLGTMEEAHPGGGARAAP